MSSSVTQINSPKILAEVPQKNVAISLSPSLQDKLVDSIILQAGGVGLGIVLSIIGVLFIFRWLGLKDAVSKWAEKQSIQGEMLKSINDGLATLIRETTEHNDRMRESTLSTSQSLKELDFKITGVQKSLDGIHTDIKDLAKNSLRHQ